MNKISVSQGCVTNTNIHVKFFSDGLLYINVVGMKPMQAVPGGVCFIPSHHIAEAPIQKEVMEKACQDLFPDFNVWYGILHIDRTTLGSLIAIPLKPGQSIQKKEMGNCAILSVK